MPIYHSLQEEIVDLISTMTQSNQHHFFRLLTTYTFAKLSSMMRTMVQTEDRGTLPINMYVINLAVSGSGKGYSTNIIEERLVNQFRERYLNDTFHHFASEHIEVEARVRANRKNADYTRINNDLKREFDSLGPLVFSFDSATVPAIKQMRDKLLLANAGSMNLEIDEIGSNFLSHGEIFGTFLELYDKGLVKQKLLKNTAENLRGEEIIGMTPTNLMLFGTPSKLLDGSKTEEEFKTMLEAGFARRCFFGYSSTQNQQVFKDANELYNALTNRAVFNKIDKINQHLANLSARSRFNKIIQIEKPITIQMLDYKLQCEEKAKKYLDHQEVLKAEISHRYYKAVKLAGAYAFVDNSPKITANHLSCAIQLAEDSGENFNRIINKEGAYVRLAHYLSSIGRPVTHVDLISDLPFFKGSKADKTELIQLATAYGYQNNIVITKHFSDDIEMFSGEVLQQVDLNKIHISYSTDITENYNQETAAFTDLHMLICSSGYHYCNHAFKKGYRNKDNAIPGFDLLIVDVDGTIPLSVAQKLLKEYTAFFSTTKRSTPEKERYRIVFPMSHYLKLNMSDYTKFMENFFNWLPFEVDTSPKDISRKWESFPGQYFYNAGELLDVTSFIPKTIRELEHNQRLKKNANMNRLERWFSGKATVGNRSNIMVRYGYSLLDSGRTLEETKESILDFNKRLPSPLNVREIEKTIFITLQRHSPQTP